MRASRINQAIKSSKQNHGSKHSNWRQPSLRLNGLFSQSVQGSTNITLNPMSWTTQTATIASTKIKDAGVVIIPVDKKNYSYKMETSLSTRIPTEDTSARIYFSQPPPSHIEDKQAAANLGINHVYIHQNYYRNGSIPSLYMVAFDPHKSSNSDRSLKSYMEMLKLHFFVYNPSGVVSDISIDRESIEHLLPNKEALGEDDTEIEYGAFLLDTKPEDKTARGAQMSLFFKTPGGIWCISCHTSYVNLVSNLESYVAPMLHNLRLDLKATSPTASKGPLRMPASSPSLLQQLSGNTPRILEHVPAATSGVFRDALTFATTPSPSPSPSSPSPSTAAPPAPADPVTTTTTAAAPAKTTNAKPSPSSAATTPSSSSTTAAATPARNITADEEQ